MAEKIAQLYRMSTKDHICPYGIKSKDLLKRKGYTVNDHLLRTREETDAFKKKHNVETTPQTFILDRRIGGYNDLRKFFGKKSKEDQKGKTYQPVIAVFLTTFLMAAALSFFLYGDFFTVKMIEWFIALSMCILAILKLRDLYAFSNQFITYDLIAIKWVPYAYVYPFAEAFVGIGMLGNILIPLVIPTAFFIGLAGSLSVIKAVYIDKRDLKCACVGGNSRVPLGFISLTENLMMVGMAIWMALKFYIL